MRIDVTQQLRQLNGEPLANTTEACRLCGRSQEETPVILRDILCNALMTSRRDQKAVDGKKQVEQYELALRIQREDEVELSTQDAGKLQNLVAEIYAPLVTGQVWLILEGDNNATES